MQRYPKLMTSRADIVIIGGGAIGLAIAIELALAGTDVVVLSRNHPEGAVHAAAGMLAPQAEELAPGPLLDLCLRSRSLYPAWVQKLEALTGLDAGYWPCGILAPQYQTSTVPSVGSSGCFPLSQWFGQAAIHRHQPGLSSQVIGGWWYPDDAQVDNQALATVLWTAAQQVGVVIHEGVTVHAIKRNQTQVTHVQTSAGDWQAQTYVLAAGAWTAAVLSVPIFPRKGQLLAVEPPLTPTYPLQQVLFGSEIYIVPRRQGRIVIGATSEDVGFAPHNTPAGIQQLLAGATRLFPPLRDYAIADLWWGYRPTTPDEAPILGDSPYDNLICATGHYRNGILLTPITAQLITDLILTGTLDPGLATFRWDRFPEHHMTDSLPSATPSQPVITKT